MLGFRLPVISDNIVTFIFGMLDPDNVGIVVGISLLSHLKAELWWGNFTPPPRLAGTVEKFRQSRRVKPNLFLFT